MLQIIYLLLSLSFIFNIVTPQQVVWDTSSNNLCHWFSSYFQLWFRNSPLTFQHTSSCLHFVGLESLFAFQFPHEDCSTENDSCSYLFLIACSWLPSPHLLNYLPFSPHPSVQFLTDIFLSFGIRFLGNTFWDCVLMTLDEHELYFVLQSKQGLHLCILEQC